MPKVSVLVAVYNAEKYLRRCLDSLLNQSLKDIEIVCVDDASTDNSLALLNEYAAKDERLKVATLAENSAFRTHATWLWACLRANTCVWSIRTIGFRPTLCSFLPRCSMRNKGWIVCFSTYHCRTRRRSGHIHAPTAV